MRPTTPNFWRWQGSQGSKDKNAADENTHAAAIVVLRDAAASPEEVFPAARRQPNPTPDPRQSIAMVHAKALLALCQLVAILVVASDKKLMQRQSSSRLGWTVAAITTVAMFAVGAAMFVVTTRISYDRS